MYLEEAKIDGLKSYALETSLELKPGIGVIIGSNGVGKSNVLDAVAWSLGESNLERLRCSSYHDLFFCGPEGAQGAEKISVELSFRCGREKNAPVLKMARHAEPSGREEFFTNGSRVEKQFYIDKLSEMNLGNTVKTIIRQEEINRFIHNDPGGRIKYLSSMLESTVTGNLVESINDDYRRYLKMLVPEGDGAIRLVSRNGLMGLELEAEFPGKGMKSTVLLSGGEKTICSLAANLAFFERLNSPLYLFDEVEPSLDWTNHHQMQRMFKKLSEKRQLIIITHLRSTIELADTLHGVRARGDGTSYVKFYFEMNDRILRAYKCTT